jgi:hypothetical protein
MAVVPTAPARAPFDSIKAFADPAKLLWPVLLKEAGLDIKDSLQGSNLSTHPLRECSGKKFQSGARRLAD